MACAASKASSGIDPWSADPLGRIWFSTESRYFRVDPARLAQRAVAAIVHIERFPLMADPVESAAPVRISARQQRVVFSYAGLSLSVPERVRFRYSLEGFDRGWSDPVARREAIYTNLNPGPYRFRVIACNADGVWNSAEATIAFEIQPLFWQTWWFRLGALLVVPCFAISVSFVSGCSSWPRQLNMRFEERLAERTRIAQELHDTLLQGFLSASMQLHVAADRLPDSPAKPRLEPHSRMMSQVIEEGRNAVRGLRSSHSSSLDLEEALSLVQQELAPGR